MYAIIEHQTWVNDYAIDTGERSTLTPEQTRDILDALDIEQVKAIREDNTSNEDGDLIAYTAEEAGWWTGPDGPFYVRLYNDDNTPMDDVDREEAFDAYIADRQERGISDDDGDDKIVKAHALRSKIAQINALIESLPQDAVIVWLAGDGSWGGLPGLGLYLPEQITEDMREQYGIEEDSI